MEKKIVSSRMLSLLALYDMQTTFFRNALAGISDKDAGNRLHTKANHVAWLAGSLVNMRYGIATDMGTDMKPTTHEFFKDGKGIQDDIIYPKLSVFRNDWDIITPITRKAFEKVSNEKLDSTTEMGGMKMFFFDMIAFRIYREANCIGQIALWRKLLGYEAMKYE